MSMCEFCLIQELQPVAALGTLLLTGHFFHFWGKPLKSISGHRLKVYGRKLVELDGSSLWLRFCVCDVSYSVLSVSRLFCKGTRLNLEAVTSPFGQRMEGTRHGSLLLICPLVKPFNPEAFADVCAHFHSYYSQGGKYDIVGAPLPGCFITMISGNLKETLW